MLLLINLKVNKKFLYPVKILLNLTYKLNENFITAVKIYNKYTLILIYSIKSLANYSLCTVS